MNHVKTYENDNNHEAGGTGTDLFFPHFPGLVWMLDINGRLGAWGGTALTQQEAKQLGIALSQPLPEPLHTVAERTARTGGENCRLEFAGRTWACDTHLTTGDNGETNGQIGYARDITLEEAEKQRLCRELSAAQAASRAKSEFLSQMSHEIRTPMNAIIGMNAIAKKTSEIDKIQYCLERIENASKQLLSVINDILDLSKIEAGKFELAESEFDFEKMLQNVCDMINVKIEEKYQSFVVDFDDVFLSNLICDEVRLSQVLINLLGNAVKFTPERGKITLRIRHDMIDEEWSTLHVEVADTGIGLTKEQQERLFDSYEQASAAITQTYGGTGLGLTISKAIVEMMGGRIWVESEPGQGATFLFEVKFRWGDELYRQKIQSDGLEKENINILVVDDHEDVRVYFNNILDNFKMRSASADSGPAAIRMVEEAIQRGDPYNLIFVDWRMPGMGGMETAGKIKRLAGREAVVVLISATDWTDIEAEAKSIGINRFIPKPILPSQLFNTIMETMEYAMFTEGPETADQVYDWSGKRVLLADDIDVNREIILAILEETGIQVTCAHTGREALDLYTAAPQDFNLILMDIQMPEMDGLEATKAIRASGLPGSRDIPIIAMTASAFQEDVAQCLAAGMNDHVAKPVNLETLLAKLALAFDR